MYFPRSCVKNCYQVRESVGRQELCGAHHWGLTTSETVISAMDSIGAPKMPYRTLAAYHSPLDVMCGCQIMTP